MERKGACERIIRSKNENCPFKEQTTLGFACTENLDTDVGSDFIHKAESENDWSVL